jgi:methionyl-tRNA formyltransferase
VLRADRDGLVVAAGDGAVQVLELQPAAGRRMSAADYLRGHPIVPGTVLGADHTPPAPRAVP